MDHVNDGSEEGQERWENVLELRNVAAASPDAGLTEFLEQVALVADQDTLGEEGEATTLLTLHAAKGLEFPVVFMVGLDEGVLPHQRSFEDPESMHEERRLMYVGMTRAKDRLYLVRAFRRSQYGDSGVADPSRFLEDIPAALMVGNMERQQSRAESYFKKATSWDTGGPSKTPSWETDRNASHPKAPTTQFRSGQRVRHAHFGDGIVISSKLIGGEEEVDVAFEAMGLKRLAASQANLQVLKG
jgi:DNA helicase-2/ATP-dependent DNA helicase PcrA